jgi:cytochrome c556
MRERRNALGGALLILVGAGAFDATGADDVTAIVQQRQATMKRQGEAMATIKAYLDGRADQSTAIAGASTLVETSRNIPALFPPNTGLEQLPKSAAKSVIWKDWRKFEENAKNLPPQVDRLLASTKSGDKAEVGKEFLATGKTCGACHQTFREKRD